jgi:hypothetical protein
MFNRRYLTEITVAVAMLSAFAFVPNAQAGLLGGGGGAINGGAFNSAMNGSLSRQPLSASGSLSGTAQVQRPAIKPVVQDASERVQGSVNATSAAAIDKGEKAMTQGEAAAGKTEAAAKKTATSVQTPALHGEASVSGDVSRKGVDLGGATSGSATR